MLLALISSIDSSLDGRYNPHRFKRFIREKRGNNSVVECNLAKVEVAGSNPVSRSIFLISNPFRMVRNPFPQSQAPAVAGSFRATPGSSLFRGGIPKWLRERSAKPRFGGSNPPAASIFFPPARFFTRFFP